jgi:hypothetical protein
MDQRQSLITLEVRTRAWSSRGGSGRLIAGSVHTPLRKQALLIEDVKQGEARDHDDRGQRDREQDGRQGAGG